MLSKLNLLAREMRNVFLQMPIGTALRYAGAVLVESPRIIIRGSLDPADRHMTSVRIHKFGRWYSFEQVPFALIRELFLNEIYFLNDHWRPAKGSVVVDLGANCGTFSVLCAGLGADVIPVLFEKSVYFTSVTCG
jgi:hypothetical protein